MGPVGGDVTGGTEQEADNREEEVYASRALREAAMDFLNDLRITLAPSCR